jgi:hypothetical protein
MFNSVRYQQWYSMFEFACPVIYIYLNMIQHIWDTAAKARFNVQLYNYILIYLTILSCQLFQPGLYSHLKITQQPLLLKQHLNIKPMISLSQC